MTKKLSKKTYMIIAAVVVVLVLGLLCCKCCGSRVGYVDTQAIVARSATFRELQMEQQLKSAELERWLADSNKELKKATSEVKRKELLAKLQSELAQKQMTMQTEFAAKATQAEDELLTLIKKVASKKCLKVVLAKATVVTGGVDITEDVLALMGNDENEENADKKVEEEPVEQEPAEVVEEVAVEVEE